MDRTVRGRRNYVTEGGIAQLLREAVDTPDFPQYGYGVVQAATLAAGLGIEAVSLLELGVAGGNGLLELQALAHRHAASGVDLRPVGFDLGDGMPAPRDHRDMPSIWKQGFFAMDRERLERLLDRAELVLGDVAVTGPRFLATDPPPTGFISFDLDFHSSTWAAFDGLLLGDAERYLPRTVCYFDDTVGLELELHTRFTGELLAIDEFNAMHEHRKIGKVNGMRHKVRPFDGPWVEGIYVLHVFDHPRYDDYVYPAPDRQFPLEPSREAKGQARG